jgi:GAF domain-containing protein
VPVIVDDEVKAVLDIDSDQLSTFDDVDKLYLEKLVEVMSKTLYK